MMEQGWESKIWGYWVCVIWGLDLFFTRLLTPRTVSEHYAPHQSPSGQGKVFDQHPHLLSQGEVRFLLGSLCNCFIPGNYSSTVCSYGLNHLWEKPLKVLETKFRKFTSSGRL